MRTSRRTLAIATALLALAAGGVGIAYAVGDSEESVSGPAAERAKQAALNAVGAGTVTEVERDDGDAAARFEVEVERPNGSQVEVHLDRNYREVGREPDDDRPGETEDDDADEASEGGAY